MSPEFDMYREAGFEWPTYNAFVKWRERFTAHLKHRDSKKTSDVRIIDELVSVLDRKIKSYPQIEIKPAKIIANENISLFLEFSDWQIGACFTKRDLSNIIDNEYNYDVLTKRLSKWVEKTTKLITEYSKIGYNINRLIFTISKQYTYEIFGYLRVHRPSNNIIMVTLRDLIPSTNNFTILIELSAPSSRNRSIKPPTVYLRNFIKKFSSKLFR